MLPPPPEKMPIIQLAHPATSSRMHVPRSGNQRAFLLQIDRSVSTNAALIWIKTIGLSRTYYVSRGNCWRCSKERAGMRRVVFVIAVAGLASVVVPDASKAAPIDPYLR
jgi:hypothetical protein